MIRAAAACPGGLPESCSSMSVEQCRQLDRRASRRCRTDGFVHSCLAKAACRWAAEVVRLIRALITAAAVAGLERDHAAGPGRPRREE